MTSLFCSFCICHKQAEEFDEKVSQTVFQCLGLKPTDEAYAQASVSTTIGGLGVRRILDHANGAFTASWHEAQVITGEKWRKPPDKDCSGSTTHSTLLLPRLMQPLWPNSKLQQ